MVNKITDFGYNFQIKTIVCLMRDVKFIEQVIKYDRKQPEFYEDTNTYVKKRATDSRANKAKILFIVFVLILKEK